MSQLQLFRHECLQDLCFLCYSLVRPYALLLLPCTLRVASTLYGAPHTTSLQRSCVRPTPYPYGVWHTAAKRGMRGGTRQTWPLTVPSHFLQPVESTL